MYIYVIANLYVILFNDLFLEVASISSHHLHIYFFRSTNFNLSENTLEMQIGYIKIAYENSSH